MLEMLYFDYVFSVSLSRLNQPLFRLCGITCKLIFLSHDFCRIDHNFFAINESVVQNIA